MTQLEVRPQIILEDWPVAPEEPPVWEPREGDSSLTLGLIKARSLLAKRKGWIKGRNQNYLGGYCMIGSLEAALRPPYLHEAAQIVTDNLPSEWSYQGIVGFNDAPERRKYQVLNVLNNAIEASRKKFKKSI